MNLSGKRAIVTGSNSGIGLGVAEELAKAGAEIVLNSFTNRDEDHALAKSFTEKFGVAARYIQADLSSATQARALVEQAGGCSIRRTKPKTNSTASARSRKRRASRQFTIVLR